MNKFLRKLLHLGVVLAPVCAFSQTGYIYLHQNSTDESAAPNFNINVSGPSFNQTYTFNDQHVDNQISDLGATSNGGLYVVAGYDGTGPVYYRGPGASAWTQMPGIAAAFVDGGTGNTYLHSNAGGSAFYFNGTSYVNMGATNAGDLAFDRSGTNRAFYCNRSNGNVYRQNVTLGGWTQVSNISASRIDAAPTGQLVSNSRSATNGHVYISSYTGAGVVDLGDPGNTGTNAGDVAVGDDGVIYALKYIEQVISPSETLVGIFVFRYTGGYNAGGSWVVEKTSRNSKALTAGVNGQVWAANGALPSWTQNLWSRTPDGFWLDDEPVKANSAISNSMLIPVPAGTYTVTEADVAGWTLSKVDVYDPSNNTTVDVPSKTSTVSVADGEVVHLVYKNFLIQTFAVSNDCAGQVYFETFGTGTEATVGAALTGQTNYHYVGTPGETAWDGYYTVAGNSVQPGWGGQGGNFKDHTSGNDTGRMMIVNASYDNGEFFRRRFTGLLPGTDYSFSAWVMNVSNNVIRPNVRFEVNDPVTGATIASGSTGDVPGFGVWKQFQLKFTTTLSMVDLVLVNNNIGGDGNDLALDDIRFSLATPNNPVATISACNPSVPTIIQVTEPLGASIEYSIDGIHYQTSPQFQVGAGTYALTARYVGSVGCATSALSINIPVSCAPLPVTLAKFYAVAQETSVALSWTTTSEANSDAFEVERSADAEKWFTLGSVKSVGNSNSIAQYNFTDNAPLAGNNYYRLKMIDVDRTHTFSRVQWVLLGGSEAQVSLYPNPVSETLLLQGADLKDIAQVTIYNTSGVAVYRKNGISPAGIRVSGLPAGIYVVYVSKTNGSFHTSRINVTR